MAAAPESQPASQLRLALSSLSRQDKPFKVSVTCVSAVSPRTPCRPPHNPRSTSSSADMPDILDEPAYIPHMLPSCKEMVEEQAAHVIKPSAVLFLYSACICVSA